MKYPSQVLMTHLSAQGQLPLMIKKRITTRKKNITQRKKNLKVVKPLHTVEVLVPHQPLDAVPVPHQPLGAVQVPRLPGVVILYHPEGDLPVGVLLCLLQREEAPQLQGVYPRHPTCPDIA